MSDEKSASAKVYTLTAERLREVLDYDPETGIFMWRPRGIKPGKGGNWTRPLSRTAGSIHVHGYRHIKIDDVLHRASRLAWLYMTGAWPVEQIDHINRCRTDDRWANLREATQAQQIANQRVRKTNKSGFKGVCWCKSAKKWRAQISIGGQKYYLGSHATKEEALAVYQAWYASEYGEYAGPLVPPPEAELASPR